MKVLILFSCAFAVASAGLYSSNSYNNLYDAQEYHVPQYGYNDLHAALPEYHQAALFTQVHAGFQGGYDGIAHHALPQPPQDTPEVAHAKAQHLAAHEEARRASKYGYTLTPVETIEVQLAKAAHFKAVEEARNNKLHYTITPVETIEVQHAKAEHFAAHAKAKAQSAHDSYESYGYDHHRRRRGIFSQDQHIPVITKDGVPLDTPEVQHARAEHLAAVAKAKSEASYHGEEAGHEDYSSGFAGYSDFSGQTQLAHSYGGSYDGAHSFGGYQGIDYSSGLLGGVHSGGVYGSHDSYGSGYTLIHNGKHPVDTYEVEKAKALHYAAHAKTHHY